MSNLIEKRSFNVTCFNVINALLKEKFMWLIVLCLFLLSVSIYVQYITVFLCVITNFSIYCQVSTDSDIINHASFSVAQASYLSTLVFSEHLICIHCMTLSRWKFSLTQTHWPVYVNVDIFLGSS